jgi:hypothetical protein
MNLPNKPTGRIDTTITETEVVGNDASDPRRAAVRYVRDNFPEMGMALAVWSTGERGDHGHRVWAVEWEEQQEPGTTETGTNADEPQFICADCRGDGMDVDATIDAAL